MTQLSESLLVRRTAGATDPLQPSAQVQLVETLMSTLGETDLLAKARVGEAESWRLETRRIIIDRALEEATLDVVSHSIFACGVWMYV